MQDRTRPVWLDVDGIAPPGLRDDMASLTADLEAALPTVVDLCRRYHRLTTAAGDAMPTDPAFPDPYAAFAHLTGQVDMDAAMDALVSYVAEVTDGRRPPAPTWLAEVG